MLTKEQIEKKLSVLIGERIRQFRRAALMLGVDIGEDVDYVYASGLQKGKKVLKPMFSLHIQASWRLLKGSGICLAQSAMFSSMNGFRWVEDSEIAEVDSPFKQISSELNETFQASSITVTRVDVSDYGDLKLYMGNEYCLEVFVDSVGATESWRFFEVNSDEHLVVFDDSDI